MKKFFKNILSTIIGIVLSFIVIGILIVGVISLSITSLDNENSIKLDKNSILKIDFKNPIVEQSSENPLDQIDLTNTQPNKSIELKQVLDNIEKAKNDIYIKGIYLNVSTINGGLSQIEEIRNKLLEFKKTDKQIIAYAEYYSQTAYYLSSVADKLYLNPEGVIELKGFSASVMFYKGLLKKLDIDMQIIRHGKFKSAIEPFILDRMSDENRAQLKLYLDNISENIFDSIASQRNIKIENIKNYINQLSLNTAINCKELGFIDELLYEDQVEDTLKIIHEEEKLNFISLNKYNKVTLNENKKISRNKIAIIYATGEINSGKGSHNTIGSATTVKAIKNAREDKKVKAVVLRINSPGGSALASDVIWRETILTKKVKPIVVSMGDYAASGGYYIACAADSIVANPTTLTGSIGVFGMIPNMQNFYKNKLGITIDTVNSHKYSDMGINRSLSNFEKGKIQESIEKIYDTFISNVAKGRNMPKQEIDKIGQGRIWSGYNAKEIGLVDVFGGLEKAIQIAATISKIDDYRIISLPKKEKSFEKLIKELSGDSKNASLILEKIGIQNNYITPIEKLITNDKIQTRLPYIIELK